MPDGSSSAAPVVTPGPSERSRRPTACTLARRASAVTAPLPAASLDADGIGDRLASAARSARGDAAVGPIQLRRAPAAAELRDQIDAGDQLLALYAEQADLCGESRGLRGQQRRIDDDAGLVLIQRQRLGFFRILDRGTLQRCLLFQHTQARKIILDRLECGQYGLTIICDRLVVVGSRLGGG